MEIIFLLQLKSISILIYDGIDYSLILIFKPLSSTIFIYITRYSFSILKMSQVRLFKLFLKIYLQPSRRLLIKVSFLILSPTRAQLHLKRPQWGLSLKNIFFFFYNHLTIINPSEGCWVWFYTSFYLILISTYPKGVVFSY